MTHTVTYEDALKAQAMTPIYLATSARAEGTKHLIYVGQRYRVEAGHKLVEEFVTLDAAVRKYNHTPESN